ncbi:hypothetical protein AB4331_19595, partial [Vibrio breoganii]
MAFGETCVEYDLEGILATVTALNDENIIGNLNEFHQRQKDSFGDGEVTLDEFGLPVVNITRANLDWLSKGLESGQK